MNEDHIVEVRVLGVLHAHMDRRNALGHDGKPGWVARKLALHTRIFHPEHPHRLKPEDITVSELQPWRLYQYSSRVPLPDGMTLFPPLNDSPRRVLIETFATEEAANIARENLSSTWLVQAMPASLDIELWKANVRAAIDPTHMSDETIIEHATLLSAKREKLRERAIAKASETWRVHFIAP